MSLIQITGQSHPVILDLLYATDKNFTGNVIYKNPLCFLHEKAMPLFEKAILLAEKQGFTLKIFDTIRCCKNPILQTS